MTTTKDVRPHEADILCYSFFPFKNKRYMHFEGLLIGACTFLIIGLFHPLVIKMEYYWGTKLWWTWLLAGIIPDYRKHHRFCHPRLILFLCLLGNWRTVRAGKTGAERVVPTQSQTEIQVG